MANMGRSSKVLELKPGINEVSKITPNTPPVDKRGVIFAMANKGVPVIHLLNIKELSLKYQLPWDPVPLPEPGVGDIFDERANRPALFWLLFSLYFGLLIIGIWFIRSKSKW